MLTDSEKLGIRDLLSFLDTETVRSLVDTITNRVIKVTSASEASDAIILHTESTASLFNRKKLTREVLFKYLNTRQVPVPGNADKLTLMETVKSFWNTLQPKNIQGCPASVAENVPYSNQTEEHNPSKGFLQEQVIFQNVPETNNQPEIQEMAQEFTLWFYQLLSSISNCTYGSNSISEHFWGDSCFKATLRESGNIDTREAQGSTEVSNLFFQILVNHKFLLNPNLNGGGVLGKLNRYGFAVIAVCGTAHQQGSCDGIFEQAFGLLQDPSAQCSWKIKWTELRITRMSVNQAPSITDLPELMAICDK